ncbi:M24 family metallopeptidase [Sphingomonas sp. M6A6_1c]
MTMQTQDPRFEALLAAEDRALALLEVIETRGLIRPGRSEREIEQDIRGIAREAFGVARDWHKRIVRAGPNTLAIAADNPLIATVQPDDIVFLDLGPVFGTWEADVGRSYAVGDDPAKHALVAELPRQFALIEQRLAAEPDITGAALYDHACACAAAAGYRFGGRIAGHIVAEFPHARLPGERQAHHISPANPLPLSDPDAFGQRRYWILEVHLVTIDGAFGGFYERLARGSAPVRSGGR